MSNQRALAWQVNASEPVQPPNNHSQSLTNMHTSNSGPSTSSSSLRGCKHKAGETNTYPEKFACTSTQSEPPLHARRKAAEEQAANLVRLIDAAASPPETITDADVVRPTTKRLLKCLAYALWYHTNGTNSINPPCTGADRAKMVADNEAYQSSRAFTAFCRPQTEFIYCVNCVPNGDWHVWKNSSNGGLTGAIRAHMLKYHAYIYMEKCKAEGVVVKQLDCEELVNPGFNLEGPQPAFTREGLLERLVRWIAVDDQSMNVVEQPEFREMLLYCGQGALQNKDIPHRNKVTSEVQEAYQKARAAIIHEIKNSLGEVSLTTDLWSDELVRAFMAVTAHYMNSKGDLTEHLIAFQKLDGQHTGANVGQVLFSVIDKMGIIPKMGMITSDNASSNDTMMDELKRAFDSRGIDFDPEATRLRCFPHIINLATQAYLNALPESAEKFRQECIKQGVNLTEDQSEYLDAVKSNVVDACRDTVKAVRSSATRREAFKRNLIEGNQDGRFMLNGKPTKFAVRQPGLDCPTRWGSTADMIDDVRLLYIPILDYSIRHTDLDIPCITHKQFLALQNVSTVLSVPRRVQQLLSAERTPTLSLALPLYNNLIGIWRTCITKFPEQQHAISVGIDKIQEYIVKTRKSPAYAFAMFVNPHIKMSWIDSAWASSPAETTPLAENALNTIKSRLLVYAEERDQKLLKRCAQIESTYTTRADRAAASQQNGYAELLLLGETIDRAPNHPLSSLVIGNTTTLDSSTPNLGLDSPDSSASFTLPAYLPNSDPHTVASSSLDHESRQLSYAKLVSRLSPEQLRAKHLAQVEEEIAIWLGIGPLPLVTDPKNPLKKENMNMVEFWKRNGEALPLIHRMAVDVLPAQASSVSSERVFSSSKLTCTRERNRISAELVEALQVLKYSVRQHRSPDLNPRLLDFTERIAPVGDDVVE